MKTSSSFIVATIAFYAFFSSPTVVVAQEKSAPPPPKLEKLEEEAESTLKLSKPESEKLKTVEKRENGKVTEVQVRSGKSTYTVKPNNAPKGTPEGDANRAAQWKILEFGGKKETKEVESLPVLSAGPHSTSKTGTTKPALVANSVAASASTTTTAASASKVTEKK